MSRSLPPGAPAKLTAAGLKAWLHNLTGGGEDVARFVVDTMNDDDVPRNVRLQAATFIAERLFGKADQHTTHEVSFNPLLLRVSGLSDAQLRDFSLGEAPIPDELIECSYRELPPGEEVDDGASLV